MKKAIRLATCIILCLVLIACGRLEEEVSYNTDIKETGTAAVVTQKSTEIETQPNKAETASEASKIPTTVKATAATTKLAEKSSVKSSAQSNTELKDKAKEKTTKKTTEKTTENTAVVLSTTKKSTQKHTDEKATQSDISADLSQAVTSSASAPAASEASTSEQTTPPSEISCVFKIECTSILGNMSKLKAGHEEFVPTDGIMLDSTTITIANGATIYDALKLICSENEIRLTEHSSAYGTYIVGIGNLDERDCGAQSGWTYTVNGEYPPKSADKYTIQNGDTVIFIYTCS